MSESKGMHGVLRLSYFEAGTACYKMPGLTNSNFRPIPKKQNTYLQSHRTTNSKALKKKHVNSLKYTVL